MAAAIPSTVAASTGPAANRARRARFRPRIAAITGSGTSLPRPAGPIRAASASSAALVLKGMASNESGTGTLTSTARVVSRKAAGYVARICKHFADKVPARFDGSDGEIAFPMGTCLLHVEGETLVLTVEGADAAAVARL